MKRIVLVFCLIIFLATFAYAEEKVKLEPIVITPSRSEETYLDTSKSVTVITGDEIARSGARNVPDVLKSQLGIVVSDYFGNGKKVNVDIRGFGETSVSNVLVMIDGRRTNQIDISGVDWSQINIDSIERIEIVRGSGSVLYGDNAVGGVINIITKKGKGSKPEAGVQYETGSYHYNSYSGFVGGDTNFMNYYVSLTQASSDGFRENSQFETTDFVGTFDMHPTNYMNIKFSSGDHKDWYGQPGALTDIKIAIDGPTATKKPDDRSKTEDYYVMPGIEIRGEGPLGKATASSDFILRGRRTASLFFNAAIPAWGYKAYWYEENNHIETFGITPKFILDSDIIGMSNRLITGVDYYSYKDEISSTDFTNVQFGDGKQKDINTIEEQTLGWYMTDTLDILPQFIVNGGVRVEGANYQFDQQAILVNKSTKRDLEYAVDAGGNYKYNNSSAIYANIARSFRFPAVDEWYQTVMLQPWGAITGGMNLDLEPQTSMHYEIGIKDNTFRWLKIMADYFIIDTKHELFYDPWVTFTNAVYDRTLRYGMDLETHVYPWKDLDFYAKYTHEKAVFIDSDYAGNQIPFVPEDKLTWGLTYTFKDCVDLNYVFNFVGPRRFISDQQNIMRMMKYYITNDIRVAYHKLGFEVYGVLNNIFNDQHSDVGSYGQYYPSNGRNFIIGAKQKF